MQTDTLIIGQGLCGTWLSFWLQLSGADFIVLDESKPNTATKVASGIINPVTGRRMVKTWMADELLPFANDAYHLLGTALEKKLITTANMLDFFSAPDRRLSFEKRAQQFETFLDWPTDEHAWLSHLNYPFGYGIVSPVYQVDLQTMLADWRSKLISDNRLIEDHYDSNDLELAQDGLQYQNIKAKRIIFCDGASVMQHHFFNLLPFAVNKGEALIIKVPGLPANHLYKKINVIAPWQDGLFWVGSNYDRDYTNDQPTAEFYGQINAWLKNFLKLPFTIENHVAALRPTTVERRPFAGMHPHYSQMGIFNGMGTKGVSLAPFFGKQLAEYLLHDTPLMKEVDVKMYARILQRV